MSFEAEVIPLFIAGCIAVSALELAVGWFTLRGRARGLFAGHVLSGDRLGLTGPIASIDHSVSIGMFGLCWAASVLLLLSALGKLNDKS